MKPNHIFYCFYVVIGLALMVCMTSVSRAEDEFNIDITVGEGGCVMVGNEDDCALMIANQDCSIIEVEGECIVSPETVTVSDGGCRPFRIKPDPGYGISAIIVNDVTLSRAYPIESVFCQILTPVFGNSTLAIEFTKVYNVITVTAGEGGVVNLIGGTVAPVGEDKTFSIEVSPGNYIAEVIIDGVPQDDVGPYVHTFSYTFENVIANHTVDVTFGPSTLTIAPEVEGDGSISLPSATEVPVGFSLACIMAPDFCQKIKDILVDGISVMDSATPPDTLVMDLVTGRATYTFNDVMSDHTIKAIFEGLNPITVEPEAGNSVTIDPDAEMEIICRGKESFTITSPYDHQGTVFSAKMSLQGDASLKWDVPELDLKADLASVDKFTLELEPNDDLSDLVIFPLEITVEPDGHWVLDSIEVDGQSLSITSPQWPFSAPNTTIAITAQEIAIANPIFRYGIELEFKPASRTVTPVISSGGDGLPHGEITPETANVVVDGENMSFTVTPDPCYQIGDVEVTRGNENPVSVMGELVLDSQTGAGTYALNSIQSDCQVAVTFDRIYYTVTTSVSPDGGGTIQPGSDSDGEAAVACGDDQTFEIRPGNSYRTKGVTVDGESIVQIYDTYAGLDYILQNVLEIHTIAAEFQKYHVISATAGNGGSVTSTTHTMDADGNAKIDDGGTAEFSINAGPGYYISILAVDGTPVMDLGTFTPEYTQTFSAVSAAHAVTAAFTRYYTIAASVGNNGVGGAISPDAIITLWEGSDQKYEFTPDDCYEVSDVVVNGLSSGPLSEYTFETISEDSTIRVDFAKKTYTVTATAGDNGAISPSDEITAICGEDIIFTITPDFCYEIDDVKVSQGDEEPASVMDAVSIDPTTLVGTYRLNDVQSDYTIDAAFVVLDPFAVTATVEGNGGAISLETTQVACGSDLNTTITPDDCYVINDVKVDRGDGIPVSVLDEVVIDPATHIGSYQLEGIASNCTVYASFKMLGPFTVTASITAAYGIISPGGAMQMACGENMTFTITPDDCHEIGDVTLTQGTGNPVSVIADVDVDSTTYVGTYELVDIRSYYTIEVSLNERDPFIVTTSIEPDGGGKIEPSGDAEGKVAVSCGTDQTFEVKFDEGYRIKDVTVDEESVAQGYYDPYSTFQHTFSNVMGDHSITAAFQRYYVISVTATDGGSVSPAAGTTKIDEGETLEFSANAASDRYIETLLVDGAPVADLEAFSTEYTRTFADLSTDHTIDVIFVKYYTIAATAGTGGTVSPTGSIILPEGTDQKYTFEPDDCYGIEDVVINGVSSRSLSEYTFENASGSNTIHVTFSQKAVTITVQTTDGGTVGPAQDGGTIGPEAGEFQLELPCDEQWSLNVTPADDYSFQDMTINGESMFTSEDEPPVNEIELEFRVVEPLSEDGALSPQSYSYSIREESDDQGMKITVDFQAPNSYDIGITFSESPVMAGDVDDDGKLSSRDAMFALLIAAEVMTPTEKEKKAADINGDGKVSSVDAVLILRGAIGLAAPGMDAVGTYSDQISVILADVHGIAGESIIVPVTVDSAGLLASGDLSIAYDSSVLRAADVLSETDALLASNVNEPGTVRISFASTGTLKSRTLIKIRFDIITDDISPLTLKRADLYRPDLLPLSVEKIDGRFESWGIPPERSALLQNFPNPFNPETWVPYQLRTAGHVSIRIYDASGRMMKELDLGYRSAGLYVSRDRAAYWDGRNTSGEEVASGTYFYSIRSGDFSAVRKMIVLQ